MSKKVLVVIQDLASGGTVSSLSNLYPYLAKEDKLKLDVFPIANSGNAEISFKNCIKRTFPILTYVYGRFFEFTNAQKICSYPLKIIKKICAKCHINLEFFLFRYYAKFFSNQYDVVVAYQEGLPTEFVSHVKCPKKICWIHYHYGSENVKDEYEIYRKFDRIVCVSAASAKSFVSIYPLLKEKTTFAYNIIDPVLIKAKSKENPPFAFCDDSFNIISVGRVAPVKQFDKIPKIAYELQQKGLDFHWYIIGQCDDVSSLLSIQDNIKKMGLEKQVSFLGAFKNPYPFFKCADLLVCTSRSEACPMIFIEAKILGLPIVSTNFNSACEFIRDGDTGVLCMLNEITDKISFLYNNRDYMKMLQENSYYDPKSDVAPIMNIFCDK